MGEIVASAPGRCGIVGNPSDMYGGNVLSCTVQERAECKLSTKNSNCIQLRNGDDFQEITSSDQFAFHSDKLDIARAALTFFQIDPSKQKFSIELSTSIPMRAGLAGSTAMLAAIVGALDLYLDLNMTPYALAETTRKVEAGIMKVVCGFQDQHMAIFGGLNFMNFAGKESLEQSQDEPFATVEPLGALIPHPPIILAHTGIQHHSGTVHSSPRQRWLAGEAIIREYYARIGMMAIPAKRALLQNEFEMVGQLMNENHAMVAELGGSGPANETLIYAALEAGAWGAKLAGAGGGGTVIAIAHDLKVVGDALLEAGADSLFYPQPSPGLIRSSTI